MTPKLRALLERWPFAGGGKARGRITPAADARQSRHTLLQEIADNSTAVIYLKDIEGRYLLVNRRYEALFHVARGEVAGKTDFDLFPADRAEAFRAFDQRVVAAGTTLEAEEIVPQDDGLHTYISIKCPVRDDAGRIYAVCGISTDITERKRAEEQQRASEEKFRALYDNTPAMMHSIDREGRIIGVSNRWLETLGYRREEVIGRPFIEFLSPQSRRFAEEVVLPEFFRTGRSSDVPYEFVTGSGRTINVLLSAIGERDESGEIVRSLAVLTDVSERVRVEDALRQSEQRFRDFAETASDWLWESGPDHRFTFVSEPFRVLEADRLARLGVRRIDNAEDVATEPEKWRQHMEVLERHEPFREFVYKSKRQGDTGFVLTSGKPLFDAAGRFLGYRGTARDITRAVRAEEALQASEQRFRDFAETESDWLWETGPDHAMTWMTGRTGNNAVDPQTRIGRRRWEYAIDVADEPEKWRQHREMLDERLPFRDFVFKIVNMHGRERYVSTSGKPIFAPDGTFAGYRGVGRDVTDAVLAQRALREGEERLELAIEAGDMGTWDYDIQRNVMQWSPRLVDLFGYAEPQTSASLEDSLAYVHPEDRPAVMRMLGTALESKGRFQHEFRLNTPGGDRWVASHGIVVIDETGRPVRMVGVVRDITARKQAETRQKLLLDELNHRVKNTLLTVQSVAMQMARETRSPELFYQAFKARLIALSKAHDLLTRGAWKGAPLQELLQQTVAAYSQEGEPRVSMSGPAIWLKPNVAVGLAMAFQELATNAAKHGALSVPGGRVAVEWQTAAPDTDAVEIRWTERGGPPVTSPRRRGFGSRLLERGLAYEFKAAVRLDFAPSGLQCVIRLPL
jgi:PAS domain S-box-containing protein